MIDEKVLKIVDIVRSKRSDDEIKSELLKYHENDIAKALGHFDKDLRLRLYKILGIEMVSDIFSYLDDASEYFAELTPDEAADILENMDADDAVDALEDIDNESERQTLISLMEESASKDVKLINSYEDGKIGSLMTTNYIKINSGATVKEAMKSVISQADENDNVSVIYVTDNNDKYYGSIDLRDLIIARENTDLESIINKNHPTLKDDQLISEVIEKLKDYAEDSLPVLDKNNNMIGIITAHDIVEAVDDEMSEDYAKLAGMTEEADLKEKLFESMRKRLPWLILLLFLGMGVSSVVGVFEGIVSQIAIIMCFQSLILDMAGNVGTQSLAVTIRVLMEEDVSGKDKLKFIFKEMQIGGANGFLLGTLTFAFVGVYLHIIKGYPWAAGFQISLCVGLALFLAMIISSLFGTIIPIFFHKIKVDPAVASGPLITTVNDLVAVISYYGLAALFLVGRI